MKAYSPIIERYEKNLQTYGDSHLSLEWPNEADIYIRYKVMLDIVKTTPCSLLDFGCGLSGLYSYIINNKLDIDYTGLDISQKFIDMCKSKFPSVPYLCCDILDTEIGKYDYIIANGVVTIKDRLSFDEMWDYTKYLLIQLFKSCGVGVAINFTSKHVDWELDKLFHLPMDTLASFITKSLTRHFVCRQDYNLFEYTTYIMK